MSRERIIKKLGKDPEKVLAQIKREKELVEKLGLSVKPIGHFVRHSYDSNGELKSNDAA